MQIPIAKTLSVLAILSIFGVIAGITAVTAQDDSDAHIAQSSKDYYSVMFGIKGFRVPCNPGWATTLGS